MKLTEKYRYLGNGAGKRLSHPRESASWAHLVLPMCPVLPHTSQSLAYSWSYVINSDQKQCLCYFTSQYETLLVLTWSCLSSRLKWNKWLIFVTALTWAAGSNVIFLHVWQVHMFSVNGNSILMRNDAPALSLEFPVLNCSDVQSID